MAYTLLKQLLEQLEHFEQQHPAAAGSPAASLAGFAAWLYARTAAPPASRGPAAPPEIPSVPPEAEIGKLLIFLARYARSYIRLGLAGTPLLTPDDFAYLATVMGHQPLSKTELIARNIHEKATGTEVIKRLLARGLVAEQPHATDRRSKLLTLTEAGAGVLRQVFGPMGQASQLIAGNLSRAERIQLLYLLQKLDAFHLPIFQGGRAGSLSELLHHLPNDTPAT
ncbi:MarR family winged helix-turn-helix transcriptional regulator [Hymenobacter psychrotolerans]|uniref:DNA-binding transcriptional regulator, MarR family n=1 Tax=Hymenobacter psychrotolerans DSM 18569 TaxID=1121959 RepID=A0A1M6VKD1_9BACT|nr:MarR family transcriptional regulator [Hymenobacter psychrotolerans]SHK81962.1 DNA-binding transcriptional regulator, MarR family [Hymenobacter psychrotolerans DSM 18569]